MLVVVIVVLPDHGAGLDAAEVAQQLRGAVAAGDRHVAQILERAQPMLRDLHLHRVGNAARACPEDPLRVAAGGGRGGERLDHIVLRHAEEPGALTVHLDPHGRVLQRLTELHVAQHAERCELLADAQRVSVIGAQIRTDGIDLDRGRCPEAHHPADDVGRFERDVHLRQLTGDVAPQPVAKRRQIQMHRGTELHLQHRLVRSAVPEIDEVARKR